MKRFRTPLAAAPLFALLATGCAGMVTLERKQPPMIELKSGPPSVGIVSVEEDAPAANNTPVGDVKGAIFHAADAYFRAHGGEANLHPGAAGDSRLEMQDVRNLSTDLLPTLNHFPAALPADVNEPLVTLVRVATWRLEKVGAAMEATVMLVFSTSTRSGKLLLADRVQAVGTQGRIGPVDVSIYPDPAGIARDFKIADGNSSPPGDPGGLFDATVKAAVDAHFYPFFSHSVKESFSLESDGPLADGLNKAKAGDWKGAHDSWMQVAANEPKNAGALYDAGVAALALGDEVQALDLIGKAVALEDHTTWEWTLKPLKARAAGHLVVAE